MGKPNDADACGGAGRSAQHLGRIAETLGLPVDAFFGSGPNASEVEQCDELLRLWAALDRRADRQRVLRVLRALATGRAGA